jgi:hypothetical protein
LTRSVSAFAPWCFHSFGQASGTCFHSFSTQSGVPSARQGSIVQLVKSTPIPMTSSGDVREAASDFLHALASEWIQSSGCCSA